MKDKQYTRKQKSSNDSRPTSKYDSINDKNSNSGSNNRNNNNNKMPNLQESYTKELLMERLSIPSPSSIREKSSIFVILYNKWCKLMISSSAFYMNIKYKLDLKEKMSSLKDNMTILKRLLKYTTRSKILLIFANISLLITSIAQSTMPFICGEILDSVIKKNSMDDMYYYTKIFCINAIIYSFFEFFWAHLFNIISDKIGYIIRKELYYNLLIKDMDYYDNNNIGHLITKVFDDVKIVQAICTTNFSSILRNIIQLIYACLQVIGLSTKLTICLLLIVPGYVIINSIYTIISKILDQQGNEYEIKAKNRSIECFNNIKVIKAFSTEEQEYGLFKNYIKKSLKISHRHSFAWSTYVASIGFATNIALITILYIGASMIGSGEISAGSLSSFLLYTIAMVNSFQDLSTNCSRVFNNLPIAVNIFKILDEKPKIHPIIKFNSLKKVIVDDSKYITSRNKEYEESKVIITPLGEVNTILMDVFPGKRKQSIVGEIHLKNITFCYPSKPDVKTLKNIDVHIKSGEVVAIVGASGSGKSSLVSLIQRFYDPSDDGTILIDNIDIREYDLKWLRKHIGFVAQEPALMSGTILYNITYGVESYTKKKLNKVIKLAHLDFIHNRALFPDGLETQVGQSGAKLSGGQKQRIAIARAMMKEPKIVIFDEATSALDAESEYQVQRAIDNLMKSSSQTMLIIAHRLSTILDCQRILVFQDGILKEDGNHDELLKKNGLYKTLFKRQLEGFNNCKQYV